MSARPDILFVIGTLGVGGSELHLRYVAPALVRRGWSVALCSLSGDGPLRQELEAGGVEVLLPPVARRGAMNPLERFTKLVVVAGYLFALLLQRRPRIAHFFLPAAYLTGAPLALLAGVPIRIMSRRSLNIYQAGHPVLARAERICHRSMAVVLGNSLSVMRDLRDEGVTEDRMALIYNGIDLSRFENPPGKESIRRALGIADDCVVLCIVANLIPYKGHKDLLDALAVAAPGIAGNWHLLVVGRDDGIGGELRRQAARSGLDGRVSFLGARSDVPALLAASDIGLSCSHEEGFSNAVLEAMAAGLPMIVTRVGGNPEAVIDGKTGVTVPPRDPASLAAAIVRLANDPALRAEYGRLGKQRVSETFSLDGCVRQYDALYRGLLAGRRPADALGGG